jgi:hypothetical protein
MAAEVIDLSEHRPHLVIDCTKDEGAIVHVVPVSLALDWASGKQPLPEPEVIRRIITEWLACLHAGCVGHAIGDL